MRFAGRAFDVMTAGEIDLIHQGALRILGEMGMEVQNETLLRACAEVGLSVDFMLQRVRFSAPLVEGFIASAPKYDWESVQPEVSATAGVYHGLFHDPETGQLFPWDENRLAFYFALARSLSQVQGACMLGSRLPVPAPLEPLFERFYCWKFQAEEGGSIWNDDICPYLLDLYQVRAEQQGKPLQQVFRANVYLVPPMKLGRQEAYQVAYFRRRGLQVSIGDMVAMGANVPVTLAGAVTLNLAEQLALSILHWAFYGEKRFHLGSSLSPLDMRTLIYPFGRPESVAANLMNAQLARYYGASYSGHGGLTSAKLPSAEAGYQKAMTALPILLAGGNFWMDAGLLSCDEIYSPVQMILDNEFLGALAHLTKEFIVSPETLGIETILAAGPGGGYIDKEHTARYFRDELWQPSLWSRTMLQPWLAEGRKLDVDYARQTALDLFSQPREPHLPDSFENDLLKVISAAQKALDSR